MMTADAINKLLETSQSMRVLYVEDDESARNSMMLVLADIFPNIITAVDGKDGLTKFKDNSFDIILTDINMPNMNGVEMISHIRNESKEIPIIILSASNEADIFTKTIKLGIDGYLLKPVDMPQLVEVLSKIIGKIVLIRENEAYKHHLEEKVEERTNQLLYQSFHDTLTSKKNKNALEHDIIKKPKGTFFLLKLDTLKQYNELYGMNVGNKLLISFSDMLLAHVQDTDFELYRVHGDTFGLYNQHVLQEQEYSQSLKQLFAVISDFSLFIPEIDESLDLDVTIALTVEQEQVIETAEMAIHYAKDNKSNFSIYDPSLHSSTKVKNELYWRSEVKSAIKEDNVVPVYQAIVNRDQAIVNRDKEANKYEVLMRLAQNSSEDEKLISPFYFLDIAKKTKQYRRLTEIMVDKSFKMMRDKNVDFSLNLSFEDIKDEACKNMLSDYIREYDLGEHLILEIVESEYIQDFNLVKSFIAQFKSMGVRVAIDDFGSGYSNFTHIIELQPDYIKIDGSLIKDILLKPESLVLVKAIIGFSKELNIRVIAEFVSSKEIFEQLLELGVDEFQGFYFAEPELNPFDGVSDD